MESHFADSKFYEEGTVAKEIIPSIISTTCIGESKAAKNSQVVLSCNDVNQQ